MSAPFASLKKRWSWHTPEGVTYAETAAVQLRVYARPAGDTAKEIGQAQMTLEVLAKNIGLSSDEEALKEFYRVQSIPKEEWAKRHAAKVAIGIAH